MLKLLVIGNNWQERNSLKTEKLKEIFYPVLSDFRWFPGFEHWSYWEEQHVIEDEYGALMG